jgi:hypothetical protein
LVDADGTSSFQPKYELKRRHNQPHPSTIRPAFNRGTIQGIAALAVVWQCAVVVISGLAIVIPVIRWIIRDSRRL